MPFLLKLAPSLIFWIIWILVIFQVPYPKSLKEANLIQLLSFFTPLFLALTFTLDLFLRFILRSILISFAIIILLSLNGLGLLNLVTSGLVLITLAITLIYFKKKRLTSSLKIPKLKALRR